MEVRGEQQQSQNAGNCLPFPKVQLPQESEANQSGKHAEKDIGAVADDDVAHAGIVPVVVGESRKPLNVGPNHICRQHEQRLPNAIPALQSPSSAVHAKFGILLREHRRFRGPQSMRGLKPMLCVRRAKLSGLHCECDKARQEGQKEERVTEPVANRCDHHLYLSLTRIPRKLWSIFSLLGISFSALIRWLVVLSSGITGPMLHLRSEGRAMLCHSGFSGVIGPL